MRKTTSKLVMELFFIYFQTLRDSKRGRLSEFCKKYKINKWTISRILKGDPSYVPELDTVLSILSGIKDNPIKDLTIGPHDANVPFNYLVLEDGHKLMKEELNAMLQLADILAHKDLLDETLMNTALNLISALHAQLITILSTKSQPDLKLINN